MCRLWIPAADDGVVLVFIVIVVPGARLGTGLLGILTEKWSLWLTCEVSASGRLSSCVTWL